MNKFEPLENEVWVDAKSFTTDYSGHYLVSNLGRCWSLKRNKFIGSWYNEHWIVRLSKNGKQEGSIMIGRLMLTSFDVEVPEHLKDLPTNKLQAMHLDGDSHNNHLENFAWGDAKENNNEINAIIRQSEAKKGEKNYNYGKHISEEIRRKISEAQKGKNNHFYGKHHSEEAKRKMSETHKGKNNQNSKPILQYTKDRTFIREWDCVMDVERELGIYNSNISLCCNGKRKTAGGYVWRYKNEVA